MNEYTDIRDVIISGRLKSLGETMTRFATGSKLREVRKAINDTAERIRSYKTKEDIQLFQSTHK